MQSLEVDTSIIEERVVPAWARKAGLFQCYMYRGHSMAPTFRPGQLLYVRSESCDIVPGDVIVFTRFFRQDFIVHRVIAETDAGFITRGDNNHFKDVYPIQHDQVSGRVELLEDHGRYRPVHGGRWGLYFAQTRWAMQRLRKFMLHPTLGVLYQILRRSLVVQRLLTWLFASHVTKVCFETPQGLLVKYMYKGKVIAHWWPLLGRFQCHKPYDLFLSPPDGQY